MAETKDVTLRLLIETVGNTNKALEDIVNSLNRVVSQFDKLASSAGKAGKDATNALDSLSKKSKEAKDNLSDDEKLISLIVDKLGSAGTAMVKWGFVLAGATASAVTSLAMVSGSFDALLTKIQVATDATTDQMSKIKDAIIDVSIASGRWPSEVANAFDAMANAGLNADEAYKALRETMGQVALATGEDMISSGQAITKVMKAMNLDIADFNRVAAVMTVLGNNTGKSIAELAGQMSTIAPVAEMAGVSLEQLAAMTEVLSKSGRGGGQELRRMLLGLIDPSSTAREAFKQLNVEIVKNDKGQLDLIATLKALKERMGDVNQYSTQMKALFSNLGISSAKVLLDEINVVLENSVEKYGSAEEKLKSMADTMATTLPAALDRSKAALSALGIQLGEPFKKPVTDLLNSFADIVVKIREWTEKNPELAMTLAKVAAGISAILIGIPTLIAGILSLVGAFLKLKEIMIAMEAALPGLNAGLATLALRLAAVTAAAWGLYQIKQFFDELDEWGKSLDTMEASLENETKLMEMSSKKVADFNQQTGESAKTLQQVVQLINQKGYRLDQATGKWAINTEAVKAAEAAAKKNADAQKVTGDQLDRQRELLMKVRPLVVENMRDSIAKLEAQKKLALAQASASGEFKDPAAEAAYKAAIAAKYDREIFDYRKKLAIQSASDLLSMGKIDSKMAMEINDFEYDHRLINVEEYIKKKQELELADYNNELSLLRSKLAEGGYGEAEKAQLEGQLAIKEKERQLLLDQQKREATDLREQATTEANDLQIELLNIEKSGIDERDAERVRAVERNIERAKREAALLKLIASGVQKGSAEYIKAENDLRQQEKLNDTKYLETKAKNRLDTKAQLLQMEVNSLADYGKMGDERLMLLQRQHDVELEQSKQSWLDQGKTREEINQLTNQKILEQAIEYNSMEEQVLQSKLDVASRITGGMAQLFGELYEAGGQQVEAFFWLNKAAAIAQAIIDGAAAVISAYKAGPYAGPVLAALTAAMVGVQIGKIMAQQPPQKRKMAVGGLVMGGSGRQDDVPILAMGGEYMLRREAVSKYGLDFIEAINRGLLSVPNNFKLSLAYSMDASRRHFAEGGYISPATAEKFAGYKTPETKNQEFQIVNVIDPQMLDRYLTTSQGQRTMINVLQANKYDVKRILFA